MIATKNNTIIPTTMTSAIKDVSIRVVFLAFSSVLQCFAKKGYMCLSKNSMMGFIRKASPNPMMMDCRTLINLLQPSPSP